MKKLLNKFVIKMKKLLKGLISLSIWIVITIITSVILNMQFVKQNYQLRKSNEEIKIINKYVMQDRDSIMILCDKLIIRNQLLENTVSNYESQRFDIDIKNKSNGSKKRGK